MCFLKPLIECLCCGVCTNPCGGAQSAACWQNQDKLGGCFLYVVVASCPSEKRGYTVTVNRGTWLQIWSFPGGSTRRIFLQGRIKLKLVCAVGSGRWMLSSWGSFSWTKIRPYFRYACNPGSSSMHIPSICIKSSRW